MKTPYHKPSPSLFACAVCALIVMFPAVVSAQTQRPAPRLFLHYTEASAPAPPFPGKSPAKPSDSLALHVRVELPAGWHINSEAPPDSFLVPTRIEADARGLMFATPRFPKPEMVFSQAMGEKLPLHTGSFEIVIPAKRAEGSAGPGLPATRVTLHYQACNDSMCLPPQSVTVEQ